MNYEELMNYRNEMNAFGNLIRLKITTVKEGYAEGEVPIHKDVLNPIGSVHGGCLFTLADVIGAAAASSYGDHVTTVEGNIHYLRAGLNTQKLHARTRELKRGKRLLTYAVSVEDQDGTLLAEGIFSYMPINRKIELP